MYYAVTRTNELQHHGIKGMKWGVRRYQNADGKKRRGYSSKSISAVVIKRRNKKVDAGFDRRKKNTAEVGKNRQAYTDSEWAKMEKDAKDAHDKIAKEFDKYQDVTLGTKFDDCDDEELRDLIIMEIEERHGVDLSNLYKDYIEKRNRVDGSYFY